MPHPVLSRRHAMLGGISAFGLVASGWSPAFAAAGGAAVPYRWATVPFGGGGFVDGFLYHPAEKGLLYARTDVGGAFRFDAAAKRWIPLQDHLGRDDADWMGVLAMAIDPRDPAKLYLACGEYLAEWAPNGAVLRSTDRGGTWQTTRLPVKLGGNQEGRGTGERLQVDPNQGGILFLGTNQNGLMKSADGGAGFAAVPGFPAKHVTLVLFDPASGTAGSASKTIYVGSGDGKGALYVSGDGGATFQPVAGLPGMIPQRAVFDEAGNLYVTLSTHLTPSGADSGAVFRRDAQSGGWKDVTPVKPGSAGNERFAYCGLDVDRSRPGTVVVSTMNRWSAHDDIFLSRDGGRKWQSIGAQAQHNPGQYRWLVRYLKGVDLMGHWIADVKIDPFNPAAMIYGTGYGLWMTGDLGNMDSGGTVHFDFAVDNLEEAVTTAMVSPPAGAALLASMWDVSGAGWDDVARTPVAGGLFNPVWENNRSIAYAELAPNYLVRTSDAAKTSGYLSDDGGATWTLLPSSPRVDRNGKGEYLQAGTIVLSAKGTAMLWAPERQPAWFSTDMGKTWKASAGWPAARDTTMPIAADKAIDGVFYAHDRAGSQLLISTDSGASFKPFIMGLPKVEGWQNPQLVVAPGTPRDIWLCLPGGLFHSPGADTPMKPVDRVEEAWMVALGKAAPGKSYHAVYLWGKIGGTAGFWRSDDIGKSWIRINDDRHQFGSLRAMAADPVEHGVVYIAPSGRGVLVGKPAA